MLVVDIVLKLLLLLLLMLLLLLLLTVRKDHVRRWLHRRLNGADPLRDGAHHHGAVRTVETTRFLVPYLALTPPSLIDGEAKRLYFFYLEMLDHEIFIFSTTLYRRGEKTFGCCTWISQQYKPTLYPLHHGLLGQLKRWIISIVRVAKVSQGISPIIFLIQSC